MCQFVVDLEREEVISMPESNKNGQVGNGKLRHLNVAQRKALEKVLRERYATLIAQQEGREQKTWNDVMAEAVQAVKKQLGVDKIEAQIHRLEQEKKALGFSYGHMPDNGSKAKDLYEEILRKRHRKENTIRREMEEKIALIWTVETVDEARRILDIQEAEHV